MVVALLDFGNTHVEGGAGGRPITSLLRASNVNTEHKPASSWGPRPSSRPSSMQSAISRSHSWYSRASRSPRSVSVHPSTKPSCSSTRMTRSSWRPSDASSLRRCRRSLARSRSRRSTRASARRCLRRVGARADRVLLREPFMRRALAAPAPCRPSTWVCSRARRRVLARRAPRTISPAARKNRCA